MAIGDDDIFLTSSFEMVNLHQSIHIYNVSNHIHKGKKLYALHSHMIIYSTPIQQFIY